MGLSGVAEVNLLAQIFETCLGFLELLVQLFAIGQVIQFNLGQLDVVVQLR